MGAFNRYLLVGASLCLAAQSYAASTTINGVTYESGQPAAQGAGGNLNVNAAMRLKKVFLFPSVDDMSGVLAPKLDEKLIQLFSRNSRFDLVRDPQVLKALSPDDKAYGKAASSQAVHREAAKVTGSDTTALLRTRNVGSETEMTLELRDAEGNLLFSETGSVPGLSPMNARWGLIDKLFQAILSKIPFDGSVTGRTANTLTLDLGSSMVRTGEEVELARIVSVQRHPLLGTVVGTDYVRAGRAKISSVDRSLSFAEVTEEYPGELISAGAKVLRTRAGTVRRSEQPEYTGERRYEERGAAQEKDPFEDRLKGDFDQVKPRYGQVGANLQYGSITHSQTAGGAPAEFSGSGIGGSLEGEVWVTKNWIVSALYSFLNASLSGNTGSVGDTSWKKAEGFVGYRFFPSDIVDGVQLTGSLGYQMLDFGLPTTTALNVGGKKYTGLALKLDGELAVLRDHKFTVGFGFQPFSSFSETGGSLGAPDSATVIGFHAGWNYRFANNFWGRLGIQFDTASGSYGNNSSVTDKRFAIGPGVYYSF
jgi:hypothetical protein